MDQDSPLIIDIMAWASRPSDSYGVQQLTIDMYETISTTTKDILPHPVSKIPAHAGTSYSRIINKYKINKVIFGFSGFWGLIIYMLKLNEVN